MANPVPAGSDASAAGDSYAPKRIDLHPLSVDQALNLVTRVSYPSVASRSSGELDG